MTEPTHQKNIVLVGNSLRTMLLYRETLIRSLAASGWAVHIVAPIDEGADRAVAMGAQLHPWGVHRSGLNPFSEIKTVFSLWKLLRSIKPDLIHTFQLKAFVYGAIAGFLARTRYRVGTVTGLGYVFSAPGIKPALLRLVTRPMIAISTRLYGAVLVTNNADLDDISRWSLARSRIHLQFGGEGVDIHHYSKETVSGATRSQLKSKLGIGERDFVVLSIGRLLRIKGIDYLVRAVEKLRERHPDIRLVIAGPLDPENPSAVTQAQLDRWIAGSGVIYAGNWSDVRPVIAISDVLAVPTYMREGMPRVILEASSMRVPVVATSVPGCIEAVVPNRSGLLVEPHSVEALEDGIETIYLSESLREQLAEGGINVAHERFDQEIVTRQLTEIYETLARS